ncbi:MAG: 23S rRNA (adenine(2503)-C(2))-methyltransferase RlmN [Acidobacteriota bacterium]|nr:23S rRNA (adenine(2503)-C(2))-methyltransferase RlmN [Acidobacteriota bacterium]
MANLVGMTSAEIEAAILELGEPRYRARQIYAGVYRRLYRDWEQFTDIGKPLREKFRARFSIEYPEISQVFVSRDGTRRYLFNAGAGQRVEAVFIPEESRDTLCVSTQVGCAMGCLFCATGRLPMLRNLSAGEIAGQVLALEADRGVQAKRLNIVVMGMGEPLNNYENVMSALRLMTCGKGMSISPRRITLSTSGIVPGIERLASEPVTPNLAISLNASTDAARDRLMPVNRKWNIAALLDACRRFPLAERRRITFEYVLIGGVNDSIEDARRLVRLLGNLRHKINLIPLNADPALPFSPPAPERVEAFAKTLADNYVTASVRRPRGEDIAAACGMLAGVESVASCRK